MARTNTKAVEEKAFTHEGGRADSRIPAVKQLERQVATCLLWEDTFYESGSTIAKEIAELCEKVPVEEIAALALRARDDFKLRHVPLFLLAQLNKRRDERPGLLRRITGRVVQRPDELGEALAILSKVEGEKSLKKIMSHGLAKGLAEAFTKFSSYQLAKWNRDEAIKLKDVLFLTHAKPKNQEQAKTWKALVDGKLETPDTWEVALSAGSDKKATWERLLREEKLGYIALLMNLRNMVQAGVERKLVEEALIKGAANSKALPFRFISAFKAAPEYGQALSDAMLKAVEGMPRLAGSTAILIDVSGSMDVAISRKSQLLRWEAAAALAILIRELCDDPKVFTFSNDLKEVRSNFRGLPLIEAVNRSQDHGGTALGRSLTQLFNNGLYKPERVVVVTDEQSADRLPVLKTKGYIVNVAPYRPGLELSGAWTRINGFSERILDWVRYYEEDLTFSS